jgi:uncharacterized protein (DUF1810 family)
VLSLNDPYALGRFVDAQERIYEQVCKELRAGEKRSHWMWFIFPQLQGLGRSSTAEQYAISGRAEAEAYLAHRVLGPRLRECTGLVNGLEGRSVDEIFGFPDHLKFRSCMTLFARVTSRDDIFAQALGKYFHGEGDPLTSARL